MNGHSPRLISGRPNSAVSEATTRSHPSARPTPPARHSPCTRATTGSGDRRMAIISSRRPPRASWRSRPVASSDINDRSAPAQKARSPAPVTTITRASPGSRTAASMARKTVSLRALRRCSRSMVNRRTGPSDSTRSSLTCAFPP